jgi:heat shock protein HslJ
MNKVHEIGAVIGKWQVIKLRDGAGYLVDVIPGSQISMEIHSDGNVTGKAGCNGYFCGMKIRDGKASVSPVGATRMYCPEPGIMDQEIYFLMDLEASKSLIIIDGDIEMLNENAEPLIKLIRDIRR